MKTIAQQLNVTDFPFIIKNKNGNIIYWENDELWEKSEYDSNGNVIYSENSDGKIIDDRPKGCEDKMLEMGGKKYRLIEVK